MGSPRVIAGAPGAAVIGGGFIGPVHVEALRRIGVEVVGLLGSSPERARDVARRLGIARVYRDLDELLDDERVGVVHVASPNEHHFEQARRVLESGRHVICEKPLAHPRRRKPRRCGPLAESRPSQAAAVNYNVRYYPLCHEIRDRIARARLGRVLSVTGSYVQDWLLYPEDYNWRVEPDGRTNLRAVADIGTHWMDLAQFLTGMPIRAVNADLATFHPRRFKPVGPTDTFSGSASAGSRPVQDGGDHDRRPWRGPPAVRRGRTRRVPRLPGHRRPQEPADHRDRRHRGGRRLGQRIAQPALDRVATRPQSSPGARPGPARPVRRGDQPLSRRTRRGVPRHVQATLCRHLRLDRRGSECRPDRRPSPPSPTATRNFASARRSPAAPPTADGPP